MQRLAAIGALVGGVVSEMTGGKFENGAMTATISWAFNELGVVNSKASKGYITSWKKGEIIFSDMNR